MSCYSQSSGMSAVSAAVTVVVAIVCFFAGFMAGKGVKTAPDVNGTENATMGVSKAEADRNASGKYFWSRSRGHGNHFYIVVDYPDARGARQSSYIHDPSCPCGAK